MNYSNTELMKLVKTCPEPKRIYWLDRLIPGFGLRTFKPTQASFVYRYRTKDGTRPLMTIGAFGIVTAEEAREKAMEFAKMVGFYGQDPKKEKEKNQTIAEVCERYRKEIVPCLSDQRDQNRYINDYIKPKLGSKKIKSVTISDIKKIYNKYKTTAPGQANRLLSCISQIFESAREWEIVDDNFVNPTRGIKRVTLAPRKRAVTPAEMPRLLKAIYEFPDVFIRSAILLLLFVGLRKAKILGLRWDQVDLIEGRIFEIEAKNAANNEVFDHRLAPAALDVLRQIPRTSSPYVFPSNRSRTGHLTEIRKSWATIKKNAGIVEVQNYELTLHALKRTLGSWLVRAGANSKQSQHALKHKTGKASEMYQVIVEEQDVVKVVSKAIEMMKAAKVSSKK